MVLRTLTQSYLPVHPRNQSEHIIGTPAWPRILWHDSKQPKYGAHSQVSGSRNVVHTHRGVLLRHKGEYYLVMCRKTELELIMLNKIARFTFTLIYKQDDMKGGGRPLLNKRKGMRRRRRRRAGAGGQPRWKRVIRHSSPSKCARGGNRGKEGKGEEMIKVRHMHAQGCSNEAH